MNNKLFSLAIALATLCLASPAVGQNLTEEEKDQAWAFLMNATAYECFPQYFKKGINTLKGGVYNPDGTVVISKKNAEEFYGIYITGGMDKAIKKNLAYLKGCETIKEAILKGLRQRQALPITTESN